MKRPRVTTLVIAALGVIAAITAWGWMRMPHNQLEVLGDLAKKARALPADRVIGKPIIDFKIPGIGRIALPEPEPASANDVTYLKKHPAAGGLLQSKSGRLFNNIKWDIDGRTYPFGDMDPLGERITVPFAFGDHGLKARLYVSGKEGWRDVVLPANYKAAPVIPAQTVESGQLKVVLKPLPVLTTFPYVDYEVSITGNAPGSRFALSFSTDNRGFYGEPYHLLTGSTLRVRVPLPLQKLFISIAECRTTPTKIRIWRDKVGSKIVGFLPGGMKVFQSDDNGCRLLDAGVLGTSSLAFGDGTRRIDNGLGVGPADLSDTSWHETDYSFLKQYDSGAEVPATIYTLGVSSGIEVELGIPDQKQFLLDR